MAYTGDLDEMSKYVVRVIESMNGEVTTTAGNDLRSWDVRGFAMHYVAPPGGYGIRSLETMKNDLLTNGVAQGWVVFRAEARDQKPVEMRKSDASSSLNRIPLMAGAASIPAEETVSMIQGLEGRPAPEHVVSPDGRNDFNEYGFHEFHAGGKEIRSVIMKAMAVLFVGLISAGCSNPAFQRHGDQPSNPWWQSPTSHSKESAIKIPSGVTKVKHPPVQHRAEMRSGPEEVPAEVARLIDSQIVSKLEEQAGIIESFRSGETSIANLAVTFDKPRLQQIAAEVYQKIANIIPQERSVSAQGLFGFFYSVSSEDEPRLAALYAANLAEDNDLLKILNSERQTLSQEPIDSVILARKEFAETYAKKLFLLFSHNAKGENVASAIHRVLQRHEMTVPVNASARDVEIVILANLLRNMLTPQQLRRVTWDATMEEAGALFNEVQRITFDWVEPLVSTSAIQTPEKVSPASDRFEARVTVYEQTIQQMKAIIDMMRQNDGDIPPQNKASIRAQLAALQQYLKVDGGVLSAELAASSSSTGTSKRLAEIKIKTLNKAIRVIIPAIAAGLEKDSIRASLKGAVAELLPSGKVDNSLEGTSLIKLFFHLGIAVPVYTYRYRNGEASPVFSYAEPNFFCTFSVSEFVSQLASFANALKNAHSILLELRDNERGLVDVVGVDLSPEFYPQLMNLPKNARPQKIFDGLFQKTKAYLENQIKNHRVIEGITIENPEAFLRTVTSVTAVYYPHQKVMSEVREARLESRALKTEQVAENAVSMTQEPMVDLGNGLRATMGDLVTNNIPNVPFMALDTLQALDLHQLVNEEILTLIREYYFKIAPLRVQDGLGRLQEGREAIRLLLETVGVTIPSAVASTPEASVLDQLFGTQTDYRIEIPETAVRSIGTSRVQTIEQTDATVGGAVYAGSSLFGRLVIDNPRALYLLLKAFHTIWLQAKGAPILETSGSNALRNAIQKALENKNAGAANIAERKEILADLDSFLRINPLEQGQSEAAVLNSRIEQLNGRMATIHLDGALLPMLKGGVNIGFDRSIQDNDLLLAAGFAIQLVLFTGASAEMLRKQMQDRGVEMLPRGSFGLVLSHITELGQELVQAALIAIAA